MDTIVGNKFNISIQIIIYELYKIFKNKQIKHFTTSQIMIIKSSHLKHFGK